MKISNYTYTEYKYITESSSAYIIMKSMWKKREKAQVLSMVSNRFQREKEKMH